MNEFFGQNIGQPAVSDKENLKQKRLMRNAIFNDGLNENAKQSINEIIKMHQVEK